MKPLCKSVLKSKQQQACWIISTKSTQVMMWKEWYCKRSLHRLLLYQLPNSCTSPIGSKLQSTVSSFHHAQPTTPPQPEWLPVRKSPHTVFVWTGSVARKRLGTTDLQYLLHNRGYRYKTTGSCRCVFFVAKFTRKHARSCLQVQRFTTLVLQTHYIGIVSSTFIFSLCASE